MSALPITIARLRIGIEVVVIAFRVIILIHQRNP